MKKKIQITESSVAFCEERWITRIIPDPLLHVILPSHRHVIVPHHHNRNLHPPWPKLLYIYSLLILYMISLSRLESPLHFFDRCGKSRAFNVVDSWGPRISKKVYLLHNQSKALLKKATAANCCCWWIRNCFFSWQEWKQEHHQFYRIPTKFKKEEFHLQRPPRSPFSLSLFLSLKSTSIFIFMSIQIHLWYMEVDLHVYGWMMNLVCCSCRFKNRGFCRLSLRRGGDFSGGFAAWFSTSIYVW